jgi:dihydrolipoamide dehydrogenase
MRIAVLGGGPGGYGAAFEAAGAGAEVVLIERSRLGGTCLNWGCIPTKTILRTARIAHDTQRAEEFGLLAKPVTVDIDRLRERKEGVVDQLVGQLEATARRLKVEVVKGHGRLAGPKTIEVELDGGGTTTIDADAVILATGSAIFKLPNIDHELPGVWTSDDAVACTRVPERILIIGGGVIGLEFASAYRSFGSEVTVVELMPALLPGNDKRVQRAAQEALSELGVEFHLGDAAETVEQVGDTMRTTLRSGRVIETDIVMSAVGRMPNSEGLGYAEAGIEMNRAAVKVDEHLRTNVPGVYAIGDLVGGMMLAHVAEEEGIAAARNAMAEFNGEAPSDTVCHECVPACVYTIPEIGIVGHSRDSAKEAGKEAVQAVSKFAANGKALAEGESEGFVQIVAEKGTGHVLGCQIVGPHAVEIIHEVVTVMRFNQTVADIAEMTHAHPTVSEVIRHACADAARKCGC